MLTSFSIKNFKRFGPDEQKIPLARLTVVLGSNSSGKSSILQAMAAVGQSWKEETPGLRQLLTDGNLVSLGYFDHIQHQRQNVPVEFRFELEGRTRIELRYEYTDHRESSDRVPWGTLTRVSLSRENEKPIVAEVVLDRFEEEKGLGRGINFIFWDLDFLREEDDSEDLSRWLRGGGNIFGLSWHLDLDTSSTTLIEGPKASKKKQALQNAKIKSIEYLFAGPNLDSRIREKFGAHLLALRDQLGGLSRIGPTRTGGQRFYQLQSTTAIDLDVGSHGGKTLEVLLRRPGVREKVNDMLEQMEISYQIRTDRKNAGPGLVIGSLYLVDQHPGGAEVALPDVGFGISQILPVLVQIANQSTRSRSSILVVEQPELHLHPAWQAKLASVIWRAMTEWKPFRLQIVLETHSEHFVRRLQRMIRAYPEKYRPEDVALVSVYRENMTGTSHIKRIGLDERGRFQGEWPEDFFPEHNQELFDPYEEKQKAEDWMRGGYMEEIS